MKSEYVTAKLLIARRRRILEADVERARADESKARAWLLQPAIGDDVRPLDYSPARLGHFIHHFAARVEGAFNTLVELQDSRDLDETRAHAARISEGNYRTRRGRVEE